MCLPTCPRMEGSNFAHCGGCHHTFATLADFDKHRPKHLRRCVDPAERGLALRNGLWSGARKVDMTMLDQAVARWQRAA